MKNRIAHLLLLLGALAFALGFFVALGQAQPTPISGGGSGSGTPGNPTATIDGTAKNGSASTYMRSDGAPALAATAVTPGTYGSTTKAPVLVVDQQGRITGASEATISAGTGDASTNTSTSVDGEAVLFSGTLGKTLKRATQTGAIWYNSGVPGTITWSTPLSFSAGTASIANAVADGSTKGAASFAAADFNAAAGNITIDYTNGQVASSGVNGFLSGTSFDTFTAKFGSTTKADVLEAAYFAADAGANDTYTATLSPAITAYVTGARYRFKANTANTGAATINFNSLGAKTIVKVAGGITTTLADNDIRAGQWVEVVYDGTNMQMISMLGNAPAGSGDALVANPLSQFAATTSAQLAGVLSDETGSSGGFTRDTGATHTTATLAGVTTITGTINYSTVDTVTAGTSVDVTLGFGSITKSADSTITFSTDSVTATRVITRVLTNSDGSNARTFTFDTVTDFAVTVPASSSSTVSMKSQGASGWALVNGSPSVLNLTADTAPASTRLVASTDATTGAERKSTLAQLGDGVTGLSANGAVVRTGANTYVAGKADLLEAAYFAADAGANDTYTATLSPAITAYVTGARYRFKANTANTGAATINFNSLGAKTIVKVAGGITTTLADNDIRSGQWCDLVYDGTNMQLQSTLGNAAAGGSTVGYALNVRSGQSSSFDPTDASTIYIGSGLVATPQTSANSSKVYIPKAGTIKVAEIMWGANNANGTNENISAYIRINDTTDTLIATVGDTNYAKRFSNTGLSIAVSAGDYYEIKIVCPTWATNPTQVFIGGHLYIE